MADPMPDKVLGHDCRGREVIVRAKWWSDDDGGGEWWPRSMVVIDGSEVPVRVVGGQGSVLYHQPIRLTDKFPDGDDLDGSKRMAAMLERDGYAGQPEKMRSLSAWTPCLRGDERGWHRVLVVRVDIGFVPLETANV